MVTAVVQKDTLEILAVEPITEIDPSPCEKCESCNEIGLHRDPDIVHAEDGGIQVVEPHSNDAIDIPECRERSLESGRICTRGVIPRRFRSSRSSLFIGVSFGSRTLLLHGISFAAITSDTDGLTAIDGKKNCR